MSEPADRRHGAIKLIGCAGNASRAYEPRPVEEAVRCRIGNICVVDRVRPLRAARGRPRAGGIAAAEGRGQVRTGLEQHDAADPPPARERVQNRIRPAQVSAPLPERKLVERRGDPAVAPRRTDVAAVGSPVQRVGNAPAAGFPREPARSRPGGITEVLGPGPGRIEVQPAAHAVPELRLEGVVDPVGPGVARVDTAPVRERPVRQRALRVRHGRGLRLVQVRRPGQLHRAQPDVR